MNLNKKWFKLDNAGKLYSSTISSKATTIFRISVYLKQNININILEISLKNTLKRYPYFKVRLKRGLFWYYLEETDKNIPIQKETYYPCMNFNFKKSKSVPLRILYYNNKLSLEMSHVLTDGNGAIEFLKLLLAQYFEIKDQIKINIPSDIQISEETEDSFQKYYKRKIPGIKIGKTAFHFPFKKNKEPIYSVTTAKIETDKLLKKSKELSASITELITALQINSIIEIIQKNKYKKRPVSINIPVNLRNIYPSKTMKNFFISITPTIDPRLGEFTFDEILQYTKNYIRQNTDKKYLNPIITRNVKNQKNILFSIFPLKIKDIGMPYIYKIFGEKNYTTGFSNLGILKFPEQIQKNIEEIEVIPPPSEGNLIKSALITNGKYTYLTFGNLTKDEQFETTFLKNLEKLNLNYELNTTKNKEKYPIFKLNDKKQKNNSTNIILEFQKKFHLN
jgi:hypothetical protein